MHQEFGEIHRPTTGRFGRNVALIAGGTGFAQLLTLLSAPFLTRLFTPEAFGLLGLFAATVGLVSSSANLRYELPIVLARTLSQATALLYLCLSIALACSATMTLVVLLWGKTLSTALNASQLVPYLLLVPVYILATGVFLPFSQWATKQRDFALLARAPIARASTTVGIQLAAGVMGLGQGWLIIGLIAGQIAAAASVATRLVHQHWDTLRPRRELWRRVAAVAKRFRDFPQFSAPQEAINAASQQMPNFILAAFFGPATVGIYWLTVRVLQMPANLISQAVRPVFYQRICEITNQGENTVTPLAKATIGLFLVGAPAFLSVIFFGPFLFAFIFGEAWREAGEMARWVALWAWFAFTNVPAFCSLQAAGAQKELLVWEVTLFVFRNGALLVFAISGTALQAIAAYALSGMAFNFLLIAGAFFHATRGHPNLFKPRG